MNKLHTPSATRERGLTLVELLVAMIIGLVVTLAVTSAVTFGESAKRTTTSVNDMGQSGSYAAYLLDRAVRSAGSGFTQSWDLGVFGCKPQVKRGATAILPRATAFPVPFEKFLGGAAGTVNLRVAPLVIGKGQSPDGISDVLMVMGGNGAAGDVPRPIIAAGASANILRLDNTVQLKKNDLTLISQVGADCLLEQVASTFVDSASNELLTLGGTGTYYTEGAGTTLAGLAGSGSAYLTLLGNDDAKNVQFQLFGVSSDRTLFSYDLLRSNGTDASQALADGVMEMHAIYGVDANKDGILDSWASPDSADYALATKMAAAGTTAEQIAEAARKIVAVRVGLVLRSSTLEKDEVTLKIPAMFSGTGIARDEVELPEGEARRYRYRVVELTIPLRNMLLLPSS
ncbi:PilW family protein [Variovorax sp. CCNWLW235]|uniref:PilW family protein n=1 Tax=Variovorax sp. CCNWLW235 TaxID=3127463 RepID=UPI003077AA87